jgi:hypothetical protein
MRFDMITTQWIMTMFGGYINDRRLILPILDNFILEKSPTRISPTPLASWRVLFGYILTLFQTHEETLLKSKELIDVAILF